MNLPPYTSFYLGLYCVRGVLVNGLVKLVQVRGVVRLTDRLDMNIAVDWVVKLLTSIQHKKG